VNVTQKLDAIKRHTGKGIEFWTARELMPVLGYVKWENFREAIGRAIVAFDMAQENSSHHFLGARTMMEVGKGAEREVTDFFLSRPACYIIAMNGDSSKPEIAEAQKYFAIQTRKMEKLERLIGDQRRVMLRNRVKDRNSKLNRTAHQVGVERFAIFHGAGIQAMYEMRLTEIKSRRGIGEKEDWLDRQGVEELAANEFRITQTDAKIRRENIQGEQSAIDAHANVGREVRQAIKRLGNTMPEELPAERPIREIEKGLGAALPKPEPNT
jgi:DNA-damage-inducible protein D